MVITHQTPSSDRLKSIIINFNREINDVFSAIFTIAVFSSRKTRIHLFLSFDGAQFIINKNWWLCERTETMGGSTDLDC